MKNLKIVSITPLKYFFKYYVNDEIYGFGIFIMDNSLFSGRFNISYIKNEKSSYELIYYTRVGNLSKQGDMEKYIKSLIKSHLKKINIECVEILFQGGD